LDEGDPGGAEDLRKKNLPCEKGRREKAQRKKKTAQSKKRERSPQ